MLWSKSYGYLPGTTVCWAGGPWITYLAYIPVTIALFVGGPSALFVIWKIVSDSAASRGYRISSFVFQNAAITSHDSGTRFTGNNDHHVNNNNENNNNTDNHETIVF